MNYTFAFMCTDTSWLEANFSTEIILALTIIVGLGALALIISIPLVLSRRYWGKVSPAKQLLLWLCWIVCVPAAIFAGGYAALVFSLVNC